MTDISNQRVLFFAGLSAQICLSTSTLPPPFHLHHFMERFLCRFKIKWIGSEDSGADRTRDRLNVHLHRLFSANIGLCSRMGVLKIFG
ncbi:MAG: hypothetical protein HN945_25355 [Deltaproteobacteria bacterium]|nr:hypothetical protein [Deltaproteobacteria bacterium]MBT7710556.1 hypothetical protein [Deltaproteobacteria bacterium]